MMTEPPQVTDVGGKSDRELVLLIQLAGRESPASRDAFSELHRRYAPGLQSFGRVTFGSTLRRAADVTDFVQEVFRQFWESRIFAFDCSLADTDVALKKLIRAWLAQIGVWVAKGWKRQHASERSAVAMTSVDLNANDVLATRSMVLTQPSADFSLIVAGALNQLSVRERDVVVTCTKHYDPISRQCRVDDQAVRDRLMRDHRFKNWDAVRQCLKRAIGKLKRALSDKAAAA